MAELTDTALHALLEQDSERGWRAFVDAYSPMILALVERAGVEAPDDRAEIYVRICERLVERGCARLRQHDPSKGPLSAWPTIVARHAVVDWVRSRAGRRRLFAGIEKLDALDRKVFELYYWEQRRVAEIVELLPQTKDRTVSIPDVFDALSRIEQALSNRQRSQLLALTARSARTVTLDTLPNGPSLALVDRRPDPESALNVKRLDRELVAALSGLPGEDVAIVRMVFVHGWTLQEVQRALHLPSLTRERVSAILARLRAALEARGVGGGEAGTRGLAFLEDEAQ